MQKNDSASNCDITGPSCGFFWSFPVPGEYKVAKTCPDRFTAQRAAWAAPPYRTAQPAHPAVGGQLCKVVQREVGPDAHLLLTPSGHSLPQRDSDQEGSP